MSKKFSCISILLMSIIFACCDRHYYVEVPGWIDSYYYLQLTESCFSSQVVEDGLHVDVRLSGVLYANAYYYAVGRHADRYIEMCDKFGDHKSRRIAPSRDDIIDIPPEQYSAIAQTVESISIASNVAWDEGHAAGAVLNDMFYISYRTYMPYVAGGYSAANPVTTVTKPLSDLKPADMRLLVAYSSINFRTSSMPSVPGRHRLTIAFVLDTGETVAYEAVADLSAIEPK